MPSSDHARDQLITVYSTMGRVRRDDPPSMRLRVGACEVTAIRDRSASRECVDAWADATGRVSCLLDTVRRSAHDIERASRGLFVAMTRLATSLARALLPLGRSAEASVVAASVPARRTAACVHVHDTAIAL